MNWEAIAADVHAVTAQVLGELQPPVEAVAVALADRLATGGKVLFCGNGGSAADAQHMAGEFLNRFLLERRPYAGLALTTDTSTLTSIANDCGFEQVFAKQVTALGRAGDALVGFSTSGNSENVCRAFEAARKGGLLTVAIVGGDGGRLAPMADHVLAVSASASTPRVQEGHQLLMHLLCERVEEILQ